MDNLEKYAAQFADMAGYTPPDAPNISVDERPTPKEALLYGVMTIREACLSLPAQYRNDFRNALQELGEEVAQKVADEANWDDIQESLEDTPVVGWVVWIVQAVVKLVTVFTDMSKINAGFDEDWTRAWARLQTLNFNPKYNWDSSHGFPWPSDDSWANNTGIHKGYLMEQDAYHWAGISIDQGCLNAYPRPTVKFSWEPCFQPPMTTEGKVFGLGTWKPRGRWKHNTGIPMRCTDPRGHSKHHYKVRFDCDVAGATSDDKDKIRSEVYRNAFIYIQPLWWPCWSPTYPSKPIPPEPGVKDGEIYKDPNRVLVERQLRILTRPKDNLNFDLDHAVNRTKSLLSHIEGKIAEGTFDLVMLDKDGDKASPFQARRVDAKKDPNWSSERSAYFYMSDSGAIEAYGHLDAETSDLSRWGFYLYNNKDERTRTFTLQDVNTVVNTTLAAVTFRLAFLDDHRECKALVAQNWHKHLKNRNPKLYRAILASAARTNPPRKKAPPKGKGLAAGVGFAPDAAPKKPAPPRPGPIRGTTGLRGEKPGIVKRKLAPIVGGAIAVASALGAAVAALWRR